MGIRLTDPIPVPFPRAALSPGMTHYLNFELCTLKKIARMGDFCIRGKLHTAHFLWTATIVRNACCIGNGLDN